MGVKVDSIGNCCDLKPKNVSADPVKREKQLTFLKRKLKKDFAVHARSWINIFVENSKFSRLFQGCYIRTFSHLQKAYMAKPDRKSFLKNDHHGDTTYLSKFFMPKIWLEIFPVDHVTFWKKLVKDLEGIDIRILLENIAIQAKKDLSARTLC